VNGGIRGVFSRKNLPFFLRKVQKITDRFGFIFWINSVSKNPYKAPYTRIFFLDLIQDLFPNQNTYVFTDSKLPNFLFSWEIGEEK